MPISLTTLLATLPSIFHSRAALELENLALRPPNRRASEVREKPPEIDLRGAPVVDLSVVDLSVVDLSVPPLA
jgi:hypothetical protein